MAELPVAIRHLDEKGAYFSPSLSQYVLSSLGNAGANVSEMSPRETAIVRLIGQGLTNSEIAREGRIVIRGSRQLPGRRPEQSAST